MSVNHNRIRVADLEKNQPNKILITNEKGELEFNDANNLQTEKYNALDCITEGKALDARQGKILKDMIDNISPDEFITKTSKSFFHMFYTGDIDMVDVDDKSYLKFEQGMTGLKSLNIQDSKNLYHGRDFILKNGSLKNVTIFHNSGSGNFKFNIPGANNLVLKPEESAHFVMRAINNTNNGGLIDYVGLSIAVDATPSVKGIIKLAGDLEGSADAPTIKGLNGKLTGVIATDSETQITQTVSEDNKVISRSKLFNWWSWIRSNVQTITGIWEFSNGLKSRFINLPSANLVTIPVNGLIERDENGQLWETHNAVRSKIGGSQNLQQTLDNGNSSNKSIVLNYESFGTRYTLNLDGVNGVRAAKSDGISANLFVAEAMYSPQEIKETGVLNLSTFSATGNYTYSSLVANTTKSGCFSLPKGSQDGSMKTLATLEDLAVNDPTNVPLTSTNLNLKYPNAVTGFRIQCVQNAVMTI